MKDRSSKMSEVSLKEKIYGSIVGSHVGSAMGAAVEGSSWQNIEKKYNGMLDSLQAYHHYGERNDWMREPGTTEDGIERQKLMISAIMDKGDRITAQDLKYAWVKYMNPNAGGVISEPFEAALLDIAKTAIPGSEIGAYCDYAGLVSFSRSSHPIGLINAGDVEGAIRDTMDVGMIYHRPYTRSLYWALVVTAGIAEATKPGATVDSVVKTILSVLREQTKTEEPYISGGMSIPEEAERAVHIAEKCADLHDLRREFDKYYNGFGMQYGMSQANEVCSKGLAIFKLCKGNTKDAIVAAVNMGRDTDCLAAVAAGLSGALTGASTVPEEWIRQCDYAASVNPHTFTRRTMREHADGLYEAVQNKMKKMKAYLSFMEFPG